MGKRRKRSISGPVAVGYARCSEDEGEDSDLSIEAQVKAIESYAAMRALQVIAMYRDDGVPASIPFEARPGGAELIDRLSQPEVRGLAVIAYRLDRPFSSAADAVAYEETWAAREASLHIVDLAGCAVDTSQPAGKFMMAVLHSVSDMEDEVSRDRGRITLAARRARKGSKPLLGERIIRGYIVPDPEGMRAVDRITALSQQGKSLRLIAEALDQEGVPTKRRAKAWSKEAIRLILRRIGKGEIRSLRAEEPASKGPVDS